MKKRKVFAISSAVLAVILISPILLRGLSAKSDTISEQESTGTIYWPFKSGIIDTASVHSVTTGQPISPTSLFADGTKRCFVYRISQYYCDSCNDYALFKITPNDVTEALPGTKCLVFADYQTGREISILMKRIQGFGQTELYIFNQDPSLPMEESGFPYYFILDQDMGISEAFIANRAWNKECTNYLERLKKKFHNK